MSIFGSLYNSVVGTKSVPNSEILVLLNWDMPSTFNQRNILRNIRFFGNFKQGSKNCREKFQSKIFREKSTKISVFYEKWELKRSI